MILLYTELSLKASYESGVDDLVQDFYMPVLGCSTSYDRIAGFFSSSSLAIAAQGIIGLIKNNGKMRLLTSPKLSQEDINIILSSEAGEQSFFEGKLLSELDSIQSDFERDHLQALGWMLANNCLEIKLAYISDKSNTILQNSLFHQKIGVLKDSGGNRLSFSGSINESASGWINNVEEFKVFREWLSGQAVFYESDQKRFEEFWNGTRNNVKIMNLPQAVAERLIEESGDFSMERLITRHYIRTQKKKSVEDNLSLFKYQEEALKMWIANNYHLLFEMATGTGKTRTALACVNYIMKLEDRLVLIIACPQTTLSKQWKENEVEPAGFIFDVSIIADGTNPNWREQLSVMLKQVSTGYYNKVVIYTTHSTGSSEDFVNIIEESNSIVSFCFVGDEAHGLGAPQNKRALLNRYKYRIGLSATPKRWFDDYGTHVLSNYFGEKSFEFSIGDALSTINPLTNKPFLVNYYYHPIFLSLSEEEIEAYKKLSNRINKLSTYAKASDEYQKKYEALLFARANIQKNAEAKIPALFKVLKSMSPVDNTLLFVSDVQIDNVMNILKELQIIAHRFTEKQGNAPKETYGGLSERQFLIEHFKLKDYQALVAISCLDEGIDIPSADTAILMANSTNPREYIQRIGRVIRQAANKGNAHIYDFIVEPDTCIDLSPEMKAFEKKIFEKELQRAREMAQNAINNAEVRVNLDKKLWEVKDYGIE